MDCKKVGELLRQLRMEQGLTQLQAAEKLCVSDKAVSKWERGAGLPDISMINAIAALYGVEPRNILDGELTCCSRNGGNMKKISFYVCPQCGNIITSASGGELSCCGRKLSPTEAKEADSEHTPKIELIDDEFYVTFSHEMTKSHYISFAAAVSYDRLYFVRLYPEQDAAARLPRTGGGTLYFYCSEHGLFSAKI